MSAPLSGLAYVRECLRRMREAEAATSAHGFLPDAATIDEEREWSRTYDILRRAEEHARWVFAAEAAALIEADQLTERTPW